MDKIKVECQCSDSTTSDTKTLSEQVRELGDKSQYHEQAEMLLNAAHVIFEAKKAVPQSPPLWAKEDEKHGTQWSIMLAKLKEEPRGYTGTIEQMRGHIRNQIQFFFWGSIKDLEDERYTKLKPYEVLAGLYSPVDTFEDFCSDYGFDIDSRTAEKTFKLTQELNAKLESIFTSEELEALTQIN